MKAEINWVENRLTVNQAKKLNLWISDRLTNQGKKA